MTAFCIRYLLLWLFCLSHPTAFGSVVEAEPRNAAEIKAESSENKQTFQRTDLTTAEHGRRQIDWVKAKGGFVSDSFEIRQADPSDPQSRYGVFAASDIQASELLLILPRDLIISNEGDDDLWTCATVLNLAREMKLGNESQYEPYVSYLLSQPHGQLPTAWSNEAKQLLIEVLGTDEYGDYLLPPDNAIHGGLGCETTTKLERNAEMLVTQRSWDQLLLPVWDMVSHRNGHWTNAQERNSVHDESHNVAVEATRFIRKGEEIFMSYDHCRDCGGRADNYGTPEILRDYGFVEMFPQKFVFHEQEVAIGLDYPYDEDKNILSENEEDLVFHWYTEELDHDDEELEFFEEQLERLKQLDLMRRPVGVSTYEHSVISGYHHALTFAIECIVRETTNKNEKDSDEEESADSHEVETGTTINTEITMQTSKMEMVQQLVDFVRLQGGFVNSKLEIRKHEPDSANSRLGVFVTSEIAPGDLLLFVPPECILFDPIGVPEGELPCGTAKQLGREMRIGAQTSRFGPYIGFLNRLGEHGYPYLPSFFSEKGKNLLLRMLGPYGGYHHLPPEEATLWIDDWISVCEGSEDDLDTKAALVTLQRHLQERLVPLMDIINHRRGNWTNSKAVLNDGARVKASKLIQAGEEVFLSYGNTDEAQFNVPNMFRDRGWIEPFPQTWLFPRNDPVPIGRGPPVGFILESDLSLRWTTDPPAETFPFEEQLERLDFLREELVSRPENLPEIEWNLILEYHEAISLALKRLVEAASEQDGCLGTESDDQTCRIPVSHFNMLDKPYQLENYNFETCDPDVSLNLSGYKVLERIQSQYQNIAYFLEPNSRNVCFDLDNIYQICGSYRPHYHEAVVHYAARFLPEIKRVLWVGGGDSMLLHEIIKFPSLEFVIGLELDEKVTRGAFKYFGTQPHWDNEKVNWYYGDAAKSLLLLPKEFFGTFDLVLVDLSETVMSNTVTKGLDIMGALSLLLKPSGIFVKNEMYFEQLSNIFKYTLQVHYYSVPLICSQCLILASNTVDFLNVDLHDHKVDNILFSQMQQPDNDLSLVRDYMHNPKAQMKCKTEEEEEEEPSEQESSPGIILVLEAENADMDLHETSINATIATSLSKGGFSVVSSESLEIEGVGSIIIAVFHDGYVITRSWRKERYLAFDIQLWGSFSKLETVKKDILSAVGNSMSSAFRIVTSGMFGVPNWKEDQQSRGPKFTLNCGETEPVRTGTEPEPLVDDTAVNAVVEEVLSSFIPIQDQIVVGVVCGPKSKPCTSLDAASKHSSVRKAVPLWTCPEIVELNEYDVDSNQKKLLCENQVLMNLQNAAKVRVIVLDPSAPFAMAQILRAIGSRIKNKRRVFDEKLVVLAASLQPKETWRNIAVDNFRLFYNEEPGFMSRILLNNTSQSLEVSAFSAGDERFIPHIKTAISNIAERSGLVPDIRYIGGVKFTLQEDFEPEEFFLASDYDQRGPYEQWKSQQPVGHQTVLQLEVERGFLGAQVVREFLTTALLVVGINAPIQQFSDLGDGELLTVVWQGGNVVVQWDGRSHVSINLFTYQEATSFATLFSGAFTSRNNPSLEVTLRDEVPRGYGRVVNFRHDIEPRGDPYWALGMDKWSD